MNRKTVFIFLGSFLLCFLLNLLNHNQFLVAFFNSSLLILSILFFQRFSGKKISTITPIFLILLGAIPLFHFNPEKIFINYAQLITLVLWLSAVTVKNKKVKYSLFFVGIILLFWGNLVSGKMLNWFLDLDKERTIFYVPSFQQVIARYCPKAIYITSQLRLLSFSLLAYFYYSLTNIARLLSLRSLYDVLLIANIYPFFRGIILSLKFPKAKNSFIYLGLLITLIAIGINRSPDKFNSLYFSSPLLLYFILLGLGKINIKIYALLLFLSLIMITSPQI